ncbi:hypothetical protein KK120_18590 [Virgibacillus dakarensis]|nr:hypothetical protein [Virgibacillus dakarensis]
MANELFKLSSLDKSIVVNFIGTYDGWTPLKWDANTVVKVPFDFEDENGKPNEPLIDTFGKKGTIALEAYCLDIDKIKIDNFRHTYAIFTDPYGTYRVYVAQANFNTKEVPDLENVGLEFIVAEVIS